MTDPGPGEIGRQRDGLEARRFHANILPFFVFLLWSGLLLAKAIQSLRWQMVHDAPILHYTAWLLLKGYRPYLDVFELNLPGTYWIHMVGLEVFGMGERAFRWLDLSWLCLTLGLAGIGLRRAGWQAAWAGTLMLGTAYLCGGPLDSMQRDWLLLLPVLGALALLLENHPLLLRSVASEVVPRGGHLPDTLRALLAGQLLGFACLIKPQAGLWLALLILLSLNRSLLGPRGVLPSGNQKRVGLQGRLWQGLPLLLGASLPLLACYVWLRQLGSWEAFVWAWREYLGPGYAHLTGDGLESPEGWRLYTASLQRTVAALWTVPRAGLGLLALGGGVWAWWPVGGAANAAVANAAVASRRAAGRESRPTPRGLVLLLLGLLAYGLAHVVIGNKQWWYHFWPACGAGILMASLLWMAPAEKQPRGRGFGLRLLGQLRWVLPLYGVAALALHLQEDPQARLVADRLAVVNHLSQRLREASRAGDRVQVLDATGGGVHAALLAGLEPGSRFLYDMHFFHHVDRPVTESLRQTLLADLRRVGPRWVVVWRESWGHRSSLDALRSFPELWQWLEGYRLVEETEEYRLLSRD